jgi:hypothetical protein
MKMAICKQCYKEALTTICPCLHPDYEHAREAEINEAQKKTTVTLGHRISERE